MYNKIVELTEKYNTKVLGWRQTIHQRPELSEQEEETAATVADALKNLGLEVHKNVGGHGVVGLLRGGRSGKTVGLRADMDALPIQEETGLSFSSRIPGVMHACGHDAHTAMLLGAACVLSNMKDDLEGNVKFIFQPAEEMSPTGGALGMIREGVLENPRVDAVFALHVWPGYETGKIATRSGALMGASDRLFVTARGKTAHGSAPHQGIDAIMIACQIVGGLQSIVSRSVAPLDSAVVSFGIIGGGSRYNIIADKVELEGTVRTLLPATQDMMPGLIERIARGYATALGGDAEIRYVRGYPPTLNAPELYAMVKESTVASMSEGHFITVENPDLAGEDFSFYARERPCLMAWLGCRPVGCPPNEMAVLHNSGFYPDAECFPFGVRFLATCAVDFLRL